MHGQTAESRWHCSIAEIFKKFVQEVNFYPLQGAYGEGNNNFLIFIFFKHIEDGGESIDSVNADYSASQAGVTKASGGVAGSRLKKTGQVWDSFWCLFPFL